MKQLFYLIIIACIAISCKKDLQKTKYVLVQSITYVKEGDAASNKKYIFYRNDKQLFDSVVILGSDLSKYKRYVFFHTNNKLDSVLQYDANNDLIQSSIATWSGNNLSAFWILTYLYDGENRITKKNYTSGAYFRLEHFADSSVYYYKPTGANPEYKNIVQYYDKSINNPFKMYKYENAYPINNFVLNNIASDFNGMYFFVNSVANIYNSDGVLTGIGKFNFFGNHEGYPNSLEYRYNGMLQYTLTFEYKNFTLVTN